MCHHIMTRTYKELQQTQHLVGCRNADTTHSQTGQEKNMKKLEQDYRKINYCNARNGANLKTIKWAAIQMKQLVG